LSEKEMQINELHEKIDALRCYMQKSVSDVVELLIEEDFVLKDIETNLYSLTSQGAIASQLRECHSLIFAKLIENRIFDDLSSSQLASLFSCFTNVSVQEEFRDLTPQTPDYAVQKIVVQITDLYSEYISKESLKNINTGVDYTIQFDLLNYVSEWSKCSDIVSCKRLLQIIGEEKQIFLGEFVKALLKINNISCELEKVCEKTGNIELLGKLREIPNITLKYVVTNQSLYI
jgi:superfamily II RNA helicase